MKDSVSNRDLIYCMDNYIIKSYVNEYDFIISKEHIVKHINYKHILQYLIEGPFAEKGYLTQALIYHLVVLSKRKSLTTNNIYGALIGMSSLIFNWACDPVDNNYSISQCITFNRKTIFRYQVSPRTSRLFCAKATIAVYMAMNTDVPDVGFLTLIKKHNTANFHDYFYNYIMAMVKAALLIVASC